MSGRHHPEPAGISPSGVSGSSTSDQDLDTPDHLGTCRRWIEGVTRGAFRMIAVYQNTWRCPGCAHRRLRTTTTLIGDTTAADTLWLGELDTTARDAATRLARLNNHNYVTLRRADNPHLLLADDNLRPRGHELLAYPTPLALERFELLGPTHQVERMTASKPWRWRTEREATDWMTAQTGHPAKLSLARRLAGFDNCLIGDVAPEVAVARYAAAWDEISTLDLDDVKELYDRLQGFSRPERLLYRSTNSWSTIGGGGIDSLLDYLDRLSRWGADHSYTATPDIAI